MMTTQIAPPFDGFGVLRAEKFIETSGSGVPDATGVYALFLKGVEELLEASGYDTQRDGEPFRLHGHLHVYTGESFGVRSRIADHLRGNIRLSTFRGTMLATLLGQGALEAADKRIDLQACEAWLTRWLSDRTLVGYKLCGCVRDIERQILSTTPSPMNIEGPGRSPYAAALRRRRRAFYERPEIVAARTPDVEPAFAAARMISRRPRR